MISLVSISTIRTLGKLLLPHNLSKTVVESTVFFQIIQELAIYLHIGMINFHLSFTEKHTQNKQFYKF